MTENVFFQFEYKGKQILFPQLNDGHDDHDYDHDYHNYKIGYCWNNEPLTILTLTVIQWNSKCQKKDLISEKYQ